MVSVLSRLFLAGGPGGGGLSHVRPTYHIAPTMRANGSFGAPTAFHSRTWCGAADEVTYGSYQISKYESAACASQHMHDVHHGGSICRLLSMIVLVLNLWAPQRSVHARLRPPCACIDTALLEVGRAEYSLVCFSQYWVSLVVLLMLAAAWGHVEAGSCSPRNYVSYDPTTEFSCCEVQGQWRGVA
jgi:hypothetical protein